MIFSASGSFDEVMKTLVDLVFGYILVVCFWLFEDVD